MIAPPVETYRRAIFVLPDLVTRAVRLRETLERLRYKPLWGHVVKAKDALGMRPVTVTRVYGGVLNIMRHCAAARAAGFDARLATPSGRNTFGDVYGIPHLPYIKWKQLKDSDLVIVPDMYSYRISGFKGTRIAYEQAPVFIKNDFDHLAKDVQVWTDSSMMLGLCQDAYPGIDIPIVPNIVDNGAFPFVPQSERTRGHLIAFPRKGPEFIEATMSAYAAMGGRYWNIELIDGLSFGELAQRFRSPQAFLASAEHEGCALPPQEAMASGIAVVGRDAHGANYCMVDQKTAMVGNTPEEAANALLQLEDAALRERLTRTAYERISRFFPENEPADFWRYVMATGSPPRSTHDPLVSGVEPTIDEQLSSLASVRMNNE